MSFSSDSSSREAIQAIQFELWPDCTSGCQYCYLNGTRRITENCEKKANLEDAFNMLNNENILKEYNAVGLIGGDFFQGQLSCVMTEWIHLICHLNALMRCNKIKEVWLASSLINIEEKIEQLYYTLDCFEFDEYEEDQRVTLCTSYDTVGRFVHHLVGLDIPPENEEDEKTLEEIQKLGIKEGDYNQESEQFWRDTIVSLKEKYPKLNIHVQTILTQDTIEKLIENPNYFDFITDMGCMIDFRYPSITRADCPSATRIEDYRSLLLNRYQNFPEKFFIEDRLTFLRFLKVFHDKYGVEKVKNLIHQPEMRSRRLKIYVDNVDINDRWNDDRNVYLECGHLIDGLCYINDEHCIYCDIENFLSKIEENNE